MSRSQVRRPHVDQFDITDDQECTILHVDMDAFYASVSLLEYPHLVDKPVIVGGAEGRGVVLAANYLAREYGVHSAMSMGRARRLAPQATIIPPNFDRYTEVSAGVMELLRSISPQLEILGMDEAFLEVAGARRRLGSPTKIAADIRNRVFDEQRVTCSIGAANTKFVAKLASTLAKPDGVLVVPPSQVVEFLHPLPVGSMWGVGEKTEEQLTRLGIKTVADIAHLPVETLQRAIGESAGKHLAELAWGRDPRPVHTHEPDRSIGAEETFATDEDDPAVVLREFLRLSEKIAVRIRRAEYVARTITIKVRFADFSTITRSLTLKTPTDSGRDIYDTAAQLFRKLGLQRARLRLVGVRASGLSEVTDTPQQLALDGLSNANWREVETALDNISFRFGKGTVKPAVLLDPPDISWDESGPE